MRKFVITRKKRTANSDNRAKKRMRAGKAALWLIGLGILMQAGTIVHAAEEDSAVSYVYHKHTGSSESEGGCYTQPVYHVHGGTEENGGSCYEAPVYHRHEGSASSGGACYETPVYHEHNSDWCYSTKHTHGDDCYRVISSSEYGCETVNWWDTSEDDYEGADYKYFEMSCGQTIHGTNSVHYHQELDCDGTGGTNERVLSCSKSENTVESYRFSCSNTEETIEKFGLSCPKTDADIELYERNCGKEEEVPYGKITVTKRLSEDKYSSSLHAVFEELNGGGLQLSDGGFSWSDSNGNHIGNGESITVTENGTYCVMADVTNEDVERSGLTISVTVSDIETYVEKAPEEIPEEVPENVPDVIPDEDPEGDEDDSQEQTEEEESVQQEDDEVENEDVEVEEEDEEIELPILPLPTEVPVILETMPITLEPEQIQEVTEPVITESGVDRREVETAVSEEIKQEVKATVTPAVKKQTVTVHMDERKSSKEEVPQIQVIEEEKTFLTSPVVKVITLTTATFATLAGLFVLYFLFRWSVAVYNDDGQGNLIYLGRCMVRNEEEGYTVILSDEIVQKAVTNRYCIKTGLFRLGRGEEELLVEKQAKRISRVIEKEMYVVI